MIGRRGAVSLGLIVLMAGLASLPIAGAALPVQTYWSGTSTGSADCALFGPFVSAGTITVSWSVSFSAHTDTYSWLWSTSYSWNNYCAFGDIQAGQGCAGPIVAGSERISQPNSGYGSSSSPPDFTVAPISVAQYNLACVGILGVGGGPQDFYMQTSSTVQT